MNDLLAERMLEGLAPDDCLCEGEHWCLCCRIRELVKALRDAHTSLERKDQEIAEFRAERRQLLEIWLDGSETKYPDGHDIVMLLRVRHDRLCSQNDELRAEVEALRKAADENPNGKWYRMERQAHKETKAENKKLREVLEDIASKQQSHHGRGWTLAQIAKAALTSDED